MTTGYTPPDGDARAFYEHFEWSVPDSYDVTSAILDHEGVDPGAVALRHVDTDGTGRDVTYGHLDAAVDAFAGWLADAGVTAGDRVAVCLPTCPEHLVVDLAAVRLGAVVVPLSMLLGEASFRHALADAGASVLVVDRQKRADVASAIPAPVETVLAVDPGAGDHPALGGLETVTAAGRSVRPESASPDDPAMILYTSGTSGDPKGVVVPHRYLIGSLPGYHCWFEVFDDETARSVRAWTPAEWAWAGALFDVLFPTLALGGTVVARLRRSGFDPGDALALVERERVTRAFLPPTALARIRNEADVAAHDVSSLGVVMCGGEPLAGSLLEWGEDALDATINDAYGQTEANALVGNCRAAFPAKPGSVGKPYPGHDVALLDADREPVETGEYGEIAVDADDPVVFAGYWRDEAATAAAFADGWLLTGDLARRDEDGYLWHAGRKDDLIVTAGYRVSPLEVERALAADPAVSEAVVGGVPDPVRGQRVKAYVLLADDVDPGGVTDRLRATVRRRLGPHKTPHEVEVLGAVPETRSGKIDRAALFGEEPGDAREE